MSDFCSGKVVKIFILFDEIEYALSNTGTSDVSFMTIQTCECGPPPEP